MAYISPFGEIYAIVTPEHRTIKKVTETLNSEKILLIPLNSSTEFQPQKIPISIIMKGYKVLGCVYFILVCPRATETASIGTPLFRRKTA